MGILSTHVEHTQAFLPAPVVLPNVFIVNSTGDSGDSNTGDSVCNTGATVTLPNTTTQAECTLRAAVQQANATTNTLAGPDEIHFAIVPGSTVSSPAFTVNCTGSTCTIALGPAGGGDTLPAISDPVVIDGYTQSGSTANANPLNQHSNAVLNIVLDGRVGGFLDTNKNCITILTAGGGSTLRGLDVRGCSSLIFFGESSNNSVLGNFMHNGTEGLRIEGSGTDAASNQIGDLTPAGRNVIYSNDGASVIMVFAQTFNNSVVGNHIGVNPSGSAAGNGAGIRLDFGAHDNFIGDPASGGLNVISNSTTEGVFISNNAIAHTTSGNLVRSNFIGTGLDGTSSMGNGFEGVLVFSVSGGDTVGGTGAGEGNTIAFNGGQGVDVVGAIDVVIVGNSIHDNGPSGNRLGIDLNGDGFTANDTNDADNGTGANDQQNFPVLSNVTSVAGVTHVDYALNSLADTKFHLEFFGNDACDPSGFGEGQVFLGSLNMTTSGNNVSGTAGPFTYDSTNKFITATATRQNVDSTNIETSEFSQCAAGPVQAPTSTPTPTPTSTPTPSPTPTNTVTATVTNTATNTPTRTSTPTATNTPTITNTPTKTSTATITPTATNTSIPVVVTQPQNVSALAAAIAAAAGERAAGERVATAVANARQAASVLPPNTGDGGIVAGENSRSSALALVGAAFVLLIAAAGLRLTKHRP